MNKVYREGMDIGVAFASGAKRMTKMLQTSAVAPHLPHVELSSIAETAITPENKAPQANHVEPSSHPEVTNAPEQGEMHKPSRTKALLRPVARLIYRLLKPAFRPVAFRLRRYLVEGLHQDVLNTHTLSFQELQRVSADLLQEMQTARESLRQDVLNTHAQSLQAVQAVQTARESLRQDVLNTHALSLQAVQAVQTTRESLRQDVLNTHALSLQELQRVSAGMLQETQAARESLRQDVLDTHALSLQELQRVSADLLQEMQTARESLRQDVLNTHALSLQELQRVSADLLQEIQAYAAILFPRLDRIEQYSCATARRVALNCNSGEILLRTVVGYVLCPASDHAVLACLLETGELERGTRLLIERLLNPDDVFVDVGANLGLHTLAAARAMQGRGKIIAFEPFEPTKCLLEKTVWINGFSDITEIHQAAVSNTTEPRKLFLGATSGHHSLFPVDIPSGFSSQSVEVPLIRLETVIRPDQKVDLIKIDAEGAELDIIDSAASVIKQNPDIALIVEFGPSHLKRTGHSTEQWLATFAELGLIHRAINADTGMLEDWSLEQLESTDTINLFFARPESEAWMKVGTTL